MKPDLAAALQFIKGELLRIEPVVVSLSQTRTWYVFTDGAFEPGSDTPATIGGMLVDQDGRCVEHFGFGPACSFA